MGDLSYIHQERYSLEPSHRSNARPSLRVQQDAVQWGEKGTYIVK